MSVKGGDLVLPFLIATFRLISTQSQSNVHGSPYIIFFFTSNRKILKKVLDSNMMFP